MKLVVITPWAVVVDGEVAHVRAEDDTGSFGVLDGHADMFTALTISVLVYRDRALSREHFVAVRGGLLAVSGGDRVQVLTREAVADDDLARLRREVLVRFRRAAADEARARRGAGKLEAALLERVADYARIDRSKVHERVR